MASVRVPTVLRPHAEGAAIIDVPAGTFGELRAAIGLRYPALAARVYDSDGHVREFISVFIEGEDARGLADDAPLAERSDVVLLPAISGGCLSCFDERLRIEADLRPRVSLPSRTPAAPRARVGRAARAGPRR